MMTGIWIEFSRQKLAYVEKVCRRKGITLKDYILDNFEWDDMPECIRGGNRPGKICEDCDFNDRCADSKYGGIPK